MLLGTAVSLSARESCASTSSNSCDKTTEACKKQLHSILHEDNSYDRNVSEDHNKPNN